MKNIKLNNWYINDNNLSIALVYYHVNINSKTNCNGIYYELCITDENMDKLILNFNTLEEAVRFTENIINKTNNITEIINKYEENIKYKGPKLEVKEDYSNILITPERFKQLLFNYFGSGKRYDIEIENDITVFDNKPVILYYLIEHLNYGGIKKDNKILLTKGDIENVLKDYLSNTNYDLIDFEYLGDFHFKRNNLDKEKSYYIGIELSIKEKEKNYCLIRNTNR